MSDWTERASRRARIRVGWEHYGSVQCEDHGRVDLSDADDVQEAIDLWNRHARQFGEGGSR